MIVEDEATLVRRIFGLYARGSSLKQICDVLNKESIPSPRARASGRYNAGIWHPSTLSGSVEMGEGILNNELYVGRRIFNKRTWVEVPTETRGFRCRPRLNPESEWIVSDEPDLRIVDQDLWDQVKARRQEARRARDARISRSRPIRSWCEAPPISPPVWSNAAPAGAPTSRPAADAGAARDIVVATATIARSQPKNWRTATGSR